ncbi:hypothetical protein B0H66DRAFT_608623 [Apodospora peruviana]|uniref:Uncharacterized protein n=1 Tax=Apodospora peruviana TaxID=516989 RepID=A0AAE0HT20_9PEZI|nr:hypothetical protein B0H66DRAFT_608623 [Apodospora peruviana]
MTSLIAPLTTTFTAPVSCASSTGIHIVACDGGSGKGCVWWAEGPLVPAASDCYPRSYDPFLGNYYSPGICPSGYTPACTSRNTLATLTETVYTCCPTALGYTYNCIGTPEFKWQSSLGCTVWLSGSEIAPSVSAALTFPSATFIAGQVTKLTSTERTEVGIGAYGIEVHYQANEDFEISITSAESSAEAQITSTTSSASKPSDTSTPPAATSGLSTGAAAGIGVGVTLAAIIVFLGVGVMLWRKKKKTRNQNSNIVNDNSNTNWSDAKTETGNKTPWEVHGDPVRVEMDGSQRSRPELGNHTHERFELG